MSNFSDDGWGSPEPQRNKSFDFNQNAVQNQSIQNEFSRDVLSHDETRHDVSTDKSPTQDNSCPSFSDSSDDSSPNLNSANRTPSPSADSSEDESEQSENYESSISSTLSDITTHSIRKNEEVEVARNVNLKPAGFGANNSSKFGIQETPLSKPAGFGEVVAQKVETPKNASLKPAGFGTIPPVEVVPSKFGRQENSFSKPAGFGEVAAKKVESKPAGFGANMSPVEVVPSKFGRQENSFSKPAGFGEVVAQKVESKPAGFGANMSPVEVVPSKFGKQETPPFKPVGFGEYVARTESPITTKSKPVGFPAPVEVSDGSRFGKQQTVVKPSGFPNRFENSGEVKPDGFNSKKVVETSDRSFKPAETSFANSSPFSVQNTKFGQQAGNHSLIKNNRFEPQNPSYLCDTFQPQPGSRVGADFQPPCSSSSYYESFDPNGRSDNYQQTQTFASNASDDGWGNDDEYNTRSKNLGSVTSRTNVGISRTQEKENYHQEKKQTFASNASDDGWDNDDGYNTNSKNLGSVTPRTNVEFSRTQEKKNYHQEKKQTFASNASDDGWDNDDGYNTNSRSVVTSRTNAGFSTIQETDNFQQNETQAIASDVSDDGWGGDGFSNTKTDRRFAPAKKSQKDSVFISEGSFSGIQEEDHSFMTHIQNQGVRVENSSSNFGKSANTGSGFASSARQQFRPAGGFGSVSSGTFGNNMSSNFDSPPPQQHSRGLGSTSSSGFGSGQISRNEQGQKNAGFGSRVQNGTSESAGFGRSGAFGGNDNGFGTMSSTGFGSRDGFGATNRDFGRREERGHGYSNHGNENERPSGCYNCGEDGHLSRECPQPKKSNERSSNCYNCGEEGHLSRECTQPRIERPIKCRNCGEEGHISRECSQPRKQLEICFNCRQEGHTENECENERAEPTEPCPRCQMEGHWSRECPTRPRDLAGNLLTSHEFVDKPEEELFDKSISKTQWWNEDNQDIVISMSADVKCPDYSSFDSFPNVDKTVLQNLKRMKLEKPMPVQRAVFLPIMNGSDVVGCAHTGCGKTIAFLLPLVTRLMQSSYSSDDVDEIPSPRLLIISPTRELALQTYQVVRMLTFKTDIKSGIAYGGISRGGNLQNLERYDKLGVLVATMGRLKDFVEAGQLSLDKLQYVVLDEADRMVDSMDFGEEVFALFGNPNERKSQMVLFSASFKDDLQKCDLIKVVRSDFAMITVNEIGTANRNIKQNILQVDRAEKKSTLFEILGIDENYVVKPDARVQTEKTLIFVNSVKFADILASYISSSGVACVPMHSSQDQLKRETNIAEFEAGVYPVMVTSNVSARGLDIKGLNHVINYDLPGKDGFDEYVNRIGRTGRAGFHGESTTFLDPYEDSEIISLLVPVLQKAGKPVPDWLMDLEKMENAQKIEEEEQEPW